MNIFGRKKGAVLPTNNDELTYTNFDKIETNGSTFVIVSVCSAKKSFKSVSHPVHNFLFLNLDDLSTNWLFPNNNQQIGGLIQIPEEYSKELNPQGFYRSYEYREKEKLPIKWLLITQYLDSEGKIYVSDASGENLTLCIDGISEIRDRVRLNDDSMLILYQSNGGEFISEIKLSEKKVIQTKELPKIQ